MTDAGTSTTRFISRREFCKRFGISRQTEWRRRKTDPTWPRPVPFSSSLELYDEAEVEALAQRLLAERDLAIDEEEAEP
jgi:predicted DNA-binding transcriptional regulator AlpA